MTTIRIYVVDTSYLLELFRVPKDSTDESHAKVKAKFSEAIERGDRLYVPLPVLFELANHIADVKDSSRRKVLADELRRAVAISVESETPWIVTPPGNAETIAELMTALAESTGRFASEFSAQRLGLTDTVIIMEAERLRKEHKSTRLKPYVVHIWTRYQAMKSLEPDTESEPFV
ncbi:hypothetical protein ANRL3_02632 [Anaerolineae bacterium]|nr:hypothetical protein ANRL3_02632 [Anaerolineae bacterium]